MSRELTPRETVLYYRPKGISGIEILAVQDSWRQWRCLNTGFGLSVPTSWYGEILHRRRQVAVTPGVLVCTEPGEVFSMPQIARGGSIDVLTIACDTFSSYLVDMGVPSEHFNWKSVCTRMSRRLS